MTEGTVLTFYSYKGGVGRTLALANVGAVLCKWGYKVLCVDWDLEAPGLQIYYQDWMNKTDCQGIVDLVIDYINGKKPDWQDYMGSVRFPGSPHPLSIINAGQPNEGYASRMQSLNWMDLYEHQGLGIFIERLRDEWKSEYDFILIDSRTGVTDIGGICTVQLPDILVSMFTANKQSLYGSVNILKNIDETRASLPFDRAKLWVLPIAARLELRVEYELAESWLNNVAEALGDLYAEWSHISVSASDMLKFARIPNIPYWSFGERLPVVEKGTDDPEDIGFSLETIAALIAHKLANTQLLVSNRDSFIAKARQTVITSTGETGGPVIITGDSDLNIIASSRFPLRDFFISYHKADRSWAEWIAWSLEEAGYTTIMQVWDFKPGSNVALGMRWASAEADRVVTVLSQDYLTSLYTNPEWAAAFAQDRMGKRGLLLPVRVRECGLEGLLQQVAYIDLVGADEAEAGERLLNGVKRERAKPTAAPRFPDSTLMSRSVAERPRFPSALPSVWNVPHRENPHFVGRDQLIEQVRETLISEQATALIAIHGLGGIGKTQLAAHYSHRHKSDYQVVWWIRAEKPATLAGDYAALATALDLPEKNTREQPLIVAAVRQWLEQHPDWLLIFDDARDAEAVLGYLPQGRAGHVLITSRDPNWRGIASPLEVRTLLREDAARFLLERTGQSDENAAHALATELGDLPLALEQAVAYMEAVGETLAGYLKLFRMHRQDLWAEDRPPTGYPNTLANTLLISFAEVKQHSADAADLLRLCAFLAPDDIPLHTLRDGAKHLPGTLAATITDILTLNKAIAALRSYSLIEKNGDSLSVHRLVQVISRDQMAEGELKMWVEAAVKIMNDAFPAESYDVRTWPVCARLLPHALIVEEQSEALNVAPTATGRLANQTGLYFLGRAQYVEAKRSFEQAMRIDEAAFGPDHPNVARDVNNLGTVLQDIGDFAAARQCYERALRIDETAFGPDHPNVAIGVNNLGDVMQALGNLSEARQCYERALRIDEAAFGPDHPNVARGINNLGRVLQLLGNLSEARQCYERALRIDEAAFGPDHPQVAIFVQNLGNVLQALGELDKARQCYERALRIFATFLGDDHPNTVIARDNLKLLD